MYLCIILKSILADGLYTNYTMFCLATIHGYGYGYSYRRNRPETEQTKYKTKPARMTPT